MAIIKYEDLNDVQRIIYNDGLALEAVTIPMINNGLNVKQLKGKPDKDGRYFDLNGNKIDSSRCWASSISGQSILAEPYNAFSEKARSWSCMFGDEEPYLCYSRCYFDYTLDEDGNKVHEWVTEGVGADVKYVALDIDKHTKNILQQIIVEAATEMDGAYETILEIPKADLMRNEILEINEDAQGVKYTDFRFKFIKMPNHIKEPVLVNSAMLLREIEGVGLGSSSKSMSFKIGDKFLEDHPNGIGRLKPSKVGDKSWRYITNKDCAQLLYEILDGQPLPKKMPIPTIKFDKTPVINADSGGDNAKNVVIAEWEVPVGVKSTFSPEMVVGSGHLVGKINSSAEEISAPSIKAVKLPDDVVIPEHPTYSFEIDNTAGTASKYGRITSIINASPNDVGAIYYLEGCVKFIVETEGKYQEGEVSNKVFKKDLSYNDKVFYTSATCDVIVNPAQGTGAGGKFSRKDAIKASYANVVMGESQITGEWELFINNNPTGVKATGPNVEVDLMAAIKALGDIPNKETGYVVTFRVVDDNPKANGAMCISKSVTVTIEAKPPFTDPIIRLKKGDDVAPAKIQIDRGVTSLTGYTIELIPNDSTITTDNVTYSIVNSTDVVGDEKVTNHESKEVTIPGYDVANLGKNVTDGAYADFAIKDLCKPAGYLANTKVATITIKGTMPEGGEITASYEIVVPEVKIFFNQASFVEVNNGEQLDVQGRDFLEAHLNLPIGPVAKVDHDKDDDVEDFNGNWFCLMPVEEMPKYTYEQRDITGGSIETPPVKPATVLFHGVKYTGYYCNMFGKGGVKTELIKN